MEGGDDTRGREIARRFEADKIFLGFFFVYRTLSKRDFVRCTFHSLN